MLAYNRGRRSAPRHDPPVAANQAAAERAPSEPNWVRTNRIIIAQLLVAGMIAVAYSEPVKPVTDAFKAEGLGVHSLAWLIVYATTVLRFAMGNLFHLQNPELMDDDATYKWFYDVFFIVAELLVLIFAGSVTSLQTSHEAYLSFPDYLVVLFAFDIFWLVSMRILHSLGSRGPCKRAFHLMVRDNDMAPLWWAAMNALLIGGLFALGLPGHPAKIEVWILYLVIVGSLVAFLLDVIFIAHGSRERTRRYRRWLSTR